MAVPFEHCVGSLADTKELEYLSALLQTELEDVRRDGTVHSRDIEVYLRSRHGLSCSRNYIEERLIPELGGNLHGPSEVMDLVQILSILLIPYFRQLQQEDDDEHEEYKNGLFQKVIQAILTDTWGKESSDELKRIDKTTMKEILEYYGELQIPDKVLEELVEAAGGDGVELNPETMLKALTSDVQLYNLEWENSVSTHFRDAMGSLQKKNDFGCRGKEDIEGEDDEVEDTKEVAVTVHDSEEESKRKSTMETETDEENKPFSFVYTAPSIDYCAESYRSQVFFICIWLSLVAVYTAYFSGDTVNDAYLRVDCEKWEDAQDSVTVAESFGCHVLNAVITWLFIFLKLSILGTSFIFLGSFGAATNTSILALLVGMATIVFSTMLSFVYAVDTPFFDTTKSYSGLRIYYLSLFLGCVVLSLQFLILLRAILPKHVVPAFYRLTKTLTNEMVRKEARTKKAAVFKIKRLVDNSSSLHEEFFPGMDVYAHSRVKSSGRALLNYHGLSDVRVRSGGMWWAWKRILDGSLSEEEGIWFHGRLMASNYYQIIVCILIFFTGLYLLDQANELTVSEPADGDDLTPQTWQLKVSIAIGGISGLLSAIGIAFVYLPSSVCTILKFRYGIIPSLGNRVSEAGHCTM